MSDSVWTSSSSCGKSFELCRQKKTEKRMVYGAPRSSEKES